MGKAEITKLEINREHRGKEICTLIVNELTEQAKILHIKTLTIGVEPTKPKYMQIYFRYGFTNFIKIAQEFYPPRTVDGEKEIVYVLYYCKEI